MPLTEIISRYRERVVASTTGLFAHAPYPLADTLSYRGDPGLFGPDSVTWPVIGDAAAFIGGLRALIVQAAHPEVVAGVHDHSRYREDPLGRLSRTSAYVTATAFGARPEVEAAARVVRSVHRKVRGTSHRERAYSADAPALAAWVHNSLTDGFLQAYLAFGPRRLTPAEADGFVAEQTQVGRLLDADPLPGTAAGLTAWIQDHPELGTSPGLVEAMAFLRSPPLPPAVRIGYRLMFLAAAATIPRRLRRILGIRRVPGAILVGKAMTGFLRWALGSSPSWHLAMVRSGAPVPPGLFRQPLPPAAVAGG
jgi:uncharacterized protein (DUF2236 family)